MSTIDLTLLGIIIEKPISAYDLEKSIKYRNLNEWTKISYPTIYKKVATLESHGYLHSSTIKNQNYAPKKMYSITKLGTDYFRSLMEKHANEEVKIPLDINTIITNLEKVSPAFAIELIGNMQKSVDEKKAKLELISSNREHIPECGKAVISQQLHFYKYLQTWLIELKQIYEKK